MKCEFFKKAPPIVKRVGKIVLITYAIATTVILFCKKEPLYVHDISYSEYQEMVNNKDTFILYIGRASCPNCSITSSRLPYAVNREVTICKLELEPYYQTEEYEKIKDDLGISYVPAFKYIENGEIKYQMNSPLKDNYFTEDANRQFLQSQIDTNIQSFIKGSLGYGPIIDEDPYSDEINAQPIIIKDGEVID